MFEPMWHFIYTFIYVGRGFIDEETLYLLNSEQTKHVFIGGHTFEFSKSKGLLTNKAPATAAKR